jgi:hypothetical protein
MEQTATPVAVRCGRCRGRIVSGEEPYCLACGHRPQGYVMRATDAGPLVMWRQKRKREACPRGHEFTPENTIQRPDGRRCRECLRDANRRYRVGVRERVAS